LDVGPLRDHMADPAVVPIVREDLGIEHLGLLVSDLVELDAVEVTEGGELIAVEPGGSCIVEVVTSPHPPGAERLTGRSNGRPMDLRKVAGPPESIKGHSPALRRLDETGQAVEWPEVIVGVDGRDRV